MNRHRCNVEMNVRYEGLCMVVAVRAVVEFEFGVIGCVWQYSVQVTD